MVTIADSSDRWLSTEQIRKQQRMRWRTVVTAMDRGELIHERRGRIRYARMSDIEAWEEKRLLNQTGPTLVKIHPDLAHLA